MALQLQSIPGGGVRVVPAGAQTRAVRAYAANLGRSGFVRTGRPGEIMDPSGLSIRGVLKGIGRGIAGFLEGGPVGGVTSLVGGGDAFPRSLQSCPSGFRKNRKGECVQEGGRGVLERFIPGGEKGTLADVAGDAVVGSFGLPARVPSQVGTITKNDGTVSPILRCPRRMVLGTDDLCYPKAILGPRSNFRKHKRPPRPPVTGEDMKAIRRASRTRDRVKELAKDVGWKVRK